VQTRRRHLAECSVAPAYLGGGELDRGIRPSGWLRKQQQLKFDIIARRDDVELRGGDHNVERRWLGADRVCGRVADEGLPGD